MDVLLFIFISILLLLILHYLLKDEVKPKPCCNAPGPLSFPMVGSYPLVQIPLWRWMFKIGIKRYGAVVKVQMPDQLYIVVNGYEAIREALENDDLLGRPNFPGRKEIFGENGGGLSLSEGTEWINHRRFSIRALKDLGFGKSGCEQFVDEEVKYLINNIDELLSQTDDNVTQVSDIIYEAVCNVISQLIFGKRAATEDPTFKEQLETIQFLTQQNQLKFSYMMICKVLKTFPNLLNLIPFERIKSMIQGPFQNILVYIQQEIDRQRDVNEAREDSYIGLYLKEKSSYFSDEEDSLDTRKTGILPILTDGRLVMTIFDLITGGTDTIANAVQWSLFYAALYPDCQNKVFHEVNLAMEAGIPIGQANKQKLPYTEAFLEEVHRIVTLLPLGVIRRATRRTELCGFTVPLDTWVVLNLHGLHHDDTLFPNPSKFMPERHLHEEQFQPRRELLSFSMGKRSCPGEQLARTEEIIMVSQLLHRYQILLPANQQTLEHIDSVLYGTDGIVRAPLKHKLEFKLRHQQTQRQP